MIQTLKGVKVVDFTLAGSGPTCTKMLAECGAEDILIEPVAGVSTREHVPHQAVFYLGGKKSLPVNLKTPEGKELMKRLLEWGDVFVSNYRMSALKRLGLDYESVKAIKPDIIYANLNAFGTKGPAVNNPGYDITAFWTRGGFVEDMAEAGTVIVPPAGMGDSACGVSLAFGIASALYHKEKTGEGCDISASLFGEAVFLNHAMIIESQFGQIYPKSRKKPARPLFNTYKCKDGWITFDALHHWEIVWPTMCNLIMEKPEHLNDYADVKETNNDGERVAALLDEGFAKWTVGEAMKILLDNNIPVEYVQHANDVIRDEQAIVNEMVAPSKLFDGSDYMTTLSPLVFNGEKAMEAPLVPLGNDTEDIMKALGYTQEEIKDHADKGIVVIADK